jgi:hypothetical protein
MLIPGKVPDTRKRIDLRVKKKEPCAARPATGLFAQ